MRLKNLIVMVSEISYSIYFVKKTRNGNNGGLNNGWNLIMENITCGDGNHEGYIEFITSGEATSDKFNISQMITRVSLKNQNILEFNQRCTFAP